MKSDAGLNWLSTWPIALTALMISGAKQDVPSADTVCSIRIGNPYLRRAHETYLIGSAHSDSVAVRISNRPGALRPTERYPYRDTTPVFGQVLKVRSLYGANADRLGAGVIAADSLVVVIHYTLRPDCWVLPTRPWLDTGVVFHITTLLRPDSEWAAGRPTFDIPVLPPFVVYPPYFRRTRDDPGYDSTLTVDQYASLVRVLPIDTDRSQDCKSVLQRIDAWAQSHESVSGFFPANEIRREMEWSCPRSRGGG